VETPFLASLARSGASTPWFSEQLTFVTYGRSSRRFGRPSLSLPSTILITGIRYGLISTTSWTQRAKSQSKSRSIFWRRRNRQAGPVSLRPSEQAAVGGGVASVKTLAGFARQSSLHSHSGRAESRQMIAADTSTWIAFLEGEQGKDAQPLDKALSDRQVLMVPVVLTELLSDPQLLPDVAETLAEVPMVDLGAGYWQRAGALRAKVLSKRRKARLGDALIAQTCLDRGIPLLTRDKAFLAFVEAARLDLVV